MSLTLLILSIIILIVSLLTIGYNFFSDKIINNRVYILFTCVIAINIAFISCYLTSGPDVDLSRYYTMLDEYKNMSLSECFDSSVYKSTPLTVFLFWTIAKFGNFSLLTLIPVFVSVLCLFYIIGESLKNTKITNINQKKDYVLSILFLLSFVNLIVLLTTVRFPMAISLISVAFYRDIYLNKRDWKTYLLYILPCCIHNGILYVIVIRIILQLKFLKKVLPILLFSIGVIFKISANLIEWIQINLVDIYKFKIIDKFVHYMQETPDLAYTDWKKNVANLVLILILFIMVEVNLYFNDRRFCSRNLIEEKKSKNIKIRNLILFFLGISVVPNILERSLILIFIIGVPVVFEFLNNINKFNFKKLRNIYLRKYIYVILITICIAMLYYQSLGWKVWYFNI